MSLTLRIITKPSLGHVHVITLSPAAKDSFDNIIESIAGHVPPDDAKEQAVLIRHPLSRESPWNGLVAFEKFGSDQIPHIHFPDPYKRNSSERYILLSPYAENSSVFIAPPDAPEKGEIIRFTPDNLYLLHFDGGSLHKFTNAYAVAFHSNDIATTSEALIQQTELHVTEELPRIPDERVFRPPRNPPSGNEKRIDDSLMLARLSFAEGNKWGVAERMFADIALDVITNGRAYGAPKWATCETFQEWLNTAQDRDFPGSNFVMDRSLFLPKPISLGSTILTLT